MYRKLFTIVPLTFFFSTSTFATNSPPTLEDIYASFGFIPCWTIRWFGDKELVKNACEKILPAGMRCIAEGISAIHWVTGQNPESDYYKSKKVPVSREMLKGIKYPDPPGPENLPLNEALDVYIGNLSVGINMLSEAQSRASNEELQRLLDQMRKTRKTLSEIKIKTEAEAVVDIQMALGDMFDTRNALSNAKKCICAE